MRKLLAVFTVLAAAAVVGISVSQAGPQDTSNRALGYVPISQVHNREILVELKNDKSASAASSFASTKGVSVLRSLPLSYTTYQIVRVPENMDYHLALAEIMNDPAVASAGPNVIKQVTEFIPNDPLLMGGATTSAQALESPFVRNNQYALVLSGALDAWEVSKGSPSVVVAVLDTGAALEHEDLENRLWVNEEEEGGTAGVDDDENGFIDDVFGWDFQGWSESQQSGGDSDNSDPSDSDQSHGTSTASIVAAQSNNGVGMSGVAGGDSADNGARLMVLRVGTNTNITVDAEIGAIDYAIENGAKIISMSFGGASGGPPEENAINRAWNAGLYVVAAAGNIGQGNVDGSGNPLVDLPAGFDNCVAVGATTIFSSQRVTGTTQLIEEELANYSKTGPELEISAPGTHIMACANIDGQYTDSVPRQFTGTSAATPVVAGLAALLWSAEPGLTNQQVRDRINSTSLDLGPAGRDSSFGFGRINMAAALGGSAPEKQGDTNGDGEVNEDDVQPLIDRFGAKEGDSNYSAAADANGDGVIDELDLFIVGNEFEE